MAIRSEPTGNCTNGQSTEIKIEKLKNQNIHKSKLTVTDADGNERDAATKKKEDDLATKTAGEDKHSSTTPETHDLGEAQGNGPKVGRVRFNPQDLLGADDRVTNEPTDLEEEMVIPGVEPEGETTKLRRLRKQLETNPNAGPSDVAGEPKEKKRNMSSQTGGSQRPLLWKEQVDRDKVLLINQYPEI